MRGKIIGLGFTWKSGPGRTEREQFGRRGGKKTSKGQKSPRQSWNQRCLRVVELNKGPKKNKKTWGCLTEENRKGMRGVGRECLKSDLMPNDRGGVCRKEKVANKV